MPYPTNIREFALGEEVLNAAKLIRYGLRSMQERDVYRDFLHLPILLFANGFERLLKTIVCFKHHEDHGVFPPIETIKTHNVLNLVDRVAARCYPQSYRVIPAAADDYAFLTADPLLRNILEVLADFGQANRYFNLDVVVGHRDSGDTSEDVWGRIVELQVLNRHPEWCNELGEPNNTVHQKVAHELLIVFERLARALARLFTIGNLSDMARANSPYLQDFYCIMHLGTRNWATT
jgi:hypothetical protein